MVEIKKVSDMEFGYAKILVFGESGSGKTYFASTYDNEKVLFINVKAESGMMTLRALGADIDVLDVDSYSDMKEAVEWIKANGSKYDVLYIDSLSQWQKNLEKEVPETGNKFAKWNTIKEYTKEVVNSFKNLPFHVVFTCEIKKDKDENQGDIIYNPSLLGSSRDEIPYWFDEVYYFTRFQQKINDPIAYKALTSAAMKYPCKSRLRLPANIDNPNLKEIIELAGFKKVDKAVQEKELKDAADTKEGLINEKQIAQIREACDDKILSDLAKHYGKPLPALTTTEALDAIGRINKDKSEVKK